MNPLTTFIIPSLKRKTLGRAIRSVSKYPFIVGYDDGEKGPGIVRNELIAKVETPWVSFVDDDDTIITDYVDRLQEEIIKTPYADLIHFRQYFLRGQIIPAWPSVEWGNIGIAFSVRREIALQFPFEQEPFEDFEFVKRIKDAGKVVIFSQYLTYRVRH